MTRIRYVPYVYARVDGDPSASYRWLEALAEADVDLLAFAAVPFGPHRVELTLFPADLDALRAAGLDQGCDLVGPYHALLVQGDDHLGALARVHRDLDEAGVEIYATNGVTDGRGGFGYVVYVRERDADAAADVVRAVATETP